MLEEGGNTFFKGLRYLEGDVGVNISTIAAMASAVKVREFTGPEYTKCTLYPALHSLVRATLTSETGGSVRTGTLAR